MFLKFFFWVKFDDLHYSRVSFSFCFGTLRVRFTVCAVYTYVQYTDRTYSKNQRFVSTGRSFVRKHIEKWQLVHGGSGKNHFLICVGGVACHEEFFLCWGSVVCLVVAYCTAPVVGHGQGRSGANNQAAWPVPIGSPGRRLYSCVFL